MNGFHRKCWLTDAAAADLIASALVCRYLALDSDITELTKNGKVNELVRIMVREKYNTAKLFRQLYLMPIQACM